MGRRSVVLLVLLALPIAVRAESQVDTAISALRKDSSMKVRTQAAIILGQRTVRKAAQRAVEDLGPMSFSIDEPGGTGGAFARGALRDALPQQLRERGFAVVDSGGMRLKSSVLRVDVDAKGGKTVIAVKASLVAVDDDGRMAAMLEGGARLSATGAIPEAKIGVYSAKALEATARTLCEDLAAKLGER